MANTQERKERVFPFDRTVRLNLPGERNITLRTAGQLYATQIIGEPNPAIVRPDTRQVFFAGQGIEGFSPPQVAHVDVTADIAAAIRNDSQTAGAAVTLEVSLLRVSGHLRSVIGNDRAVNYYAE